MSAKDIRNIVLLGHSGSGKTTLAESMLYLTGGTDRLGRIADGNTVCDYDPEEIRRQISISLAVAPVEYDSCKINVLDVPGGFDFAGEVAEAVQAADAAVIVCSAKAGMSVGAEKAWKYCEKNSLPRLLYISKTDEENSDYNAAFNTLRERFGKNIAPVVAPIWDESKKVIGIIDVLHKRAFEFGPGGGRVEIEVPENKKPVLDELYDALKESVAETSEEFMEKFFAGEDFTYAEMIHGLRQGVKDLSLFPVVCGSAIQGMGTRILMDTIVELLPQPQDARALMAENEDGESSEFVVAPGALPTAFVFKTISDQYGKYSYVKVLSGSIKPDMPMVNARTGETEKLGRLYIPKGKKYTEVKELTCGDIGAIAKMDKVKTGDTLCEPRKVVKIEPIPFDEPCYSVAIAPKTRGQEEKLGTGLNRLNEEDPTFTVKTDEDSGQTVISGMGELHLEIIVDRLKREFGVEISQGAPQVNYKESLKSKVQHREVFKKQTGGRGKFADIIFEIGPAEEGKMGLEFVDVVKGGNIPKEYIPSIQKGFESAMSNGPLAGFALDSMKITLIDGSFHPVDSDALSFEICARNGFREAARKASPVILEPIMKVEVVTPEENMGDIIGDLNKRRGQIAGMESRGNARVVDAKVPLSEMFGYVTVLRTISSGRATSSMEFSHFEEVPANLAKEIIEKTNGKKE